MSEPRYKLHWITALIEVLKTAKEAILPLIVLLFANGFNDTGKWYLDYLTFMIFGVLMIAFFITGIIKWKRFEYWFEDDELRIEYGLFVKKKRYIPFDRIQSLDYTEGILHRPFKLVKVKVETAGGSTSKKAEAELTAITKEAAELIERELADAKSGKRVLQVEDGEDTIEFPIEAEPQAKPIFKMSAKDLVILATTSGGIGIILSGAGVFLSQFAELIPFEWMYEELSSFITFGALLIALAVFIGFIIVWGLSVAMTFFSYYGFTVSLDERDIIITRGLLEKKRMTVPLNRVQSVRIIENPFRQLFGYAAVAVDSAGGGGAEGAKINLFPLVKKKDIEGPLKELFQELILDEPSQKLPVRGRAFFLPHRFHLDVASSWGVDLLFLSVRTVVTAYHPDYRTFRLVATSLCCYLHLWKSVDDAIQGVQPTDCLFDEKKNPVHENEKKLLPQTKTGCDTSRKHQIRNGCF